MPSKGIIDIVHKNKTYKWEMNPVIPDDTRAH
jgi:hypothetical protein